MENDLAIFFGAVINTCPIFIYRWICSTNQSNERLCRTRLLFSIIMGIATACIWVLAVIWFFGSAFSQVICLGFIYICMFSNWTIVGIAFIYAPRAYIALMPKIIKMIPSDRLRQRAKRNLTVRKVRMTLYFAIVGLGISCLGYSIIAFWGAYVVSR